MKRILGICSALAMALVGLTGCRTNPPGRIQAATVLPDRPTATARLPTADKVCGDGTPVVSLGDCPSAAQQRSNEQRRISQTILDIHAHGG